jgi:hypothetical protein
MLESLPCHAHAICDERSPFPPGHTLGNTWKFWTHLREFSCTCMYTRYTCIYMKMHHTVKVKTSPAKYVQADIFRFRTRRGAGDDACGSRLPSRREPLHMSRGVVQRQMTPEHANFKTLSIFNSASFVESQFARVPGKVTTNIGARRERWGCVRGKSQKSSYAERNGLLWETRSDLSAVYYSG